jgi:hypothetical protein
METERRPLARESPKPRETDLPPPHPRMFLLNKEHPTHESASIFYRTPSQPNHVASLPRNRVLSLVGACLIPALSAAGRARRLLRVILDEIGCQPFDCRTETGSHSHTALSKEHDRRGSIGSTDPNLPPSAATARDAPGLGGLSITS